ncbi:MAG: response regulator transcription factor [Candidatus Eremiobacteraeota bacterium]|nr:response regulator transcription factor [Candidatus Eremiobacteraeota bacterium]
MTNLLEAARMKETTPEAPRKKRIYLVEDEEEICEIVIKFLEREGYEVAAYYRGDTAMEALRENPPDLAILDIMLPGMDGIEILKEIRKSLLLPVIFISAKKTEVDRILGIELGADDYVPKPFSFRELTARVKALFRRIDYDTAGQSPVEKNILKTRTLTLHLDSMKLSSKTASADVTSSELSILRTLMQRPGRVYSRDELHSQLVNGERTMDTRAIDMHIKNLRRKIRTINISPCFIQSIRGVGYKFED